MLKISYLNIDGSVAGGAIGCQRDTLNVSFRIGDGLGDVAQEVLTVLHCQIQPDEERLVGGDIPFDIEAAFGAISDRHNVDAIDAVNSDTASTGDIANDCFAGHRLAAIGEPEHH